MSNYWYSENSEGLEEGALKNRNFLIYHNLSTPINLNLCPAPISFANQQPFSNRPPKNVDSALLKNRGSNVTALGIAGRTVPRRTRDCRSF
jgi:hypothetical protein